tara:strand:- start:16704 stop:16934 length:231 start_codon:yes stop_codon:yes gene_type:complete
MGKMKEIFAVLVERGWPLTNDSLKKIVKERKKTREPEHLGCGIYVHGQFDKETLVIGDTFSDADYGYVTWNGKDWI